MKVFEYLQQLRTFERLHLSFLHTLEDLDMVKLIGVHQERGVPLTVKQLLAFEIGSVATVQRRLAHLRRIGVVKHRRSALDRRSLDLSLSASTARLFVRYSALIASSEHLPKGRRAPA